MRFERPKTLVPALLIAAAAVLLPGQAQAQYSTPVRDIDQPARNYFRVHYDCAGQGCTTSTTLPSGYVFVIETVIYRIGGSQFSEQMPILALANGDLGFFLPATRVIGTFSFGVHQVRLHTEIIPYVACAVPVTGTNTYLDLHGYLVKK